jgi:predicted ribosome quality control (RQC) complex YloA/Tae2 family protein
MINFDSLTLKALIGEIAPILESGRIQKIQQPSRDKIVLGIRAGNKSYKLYVCINPKYPHLSLLTEQGEKYRAIEIPAKPPMFCMLLRKYMEGAKINAIKQPDHERIMEIYFDSYNEMGERVPLVLACELMGKHSNIVLYNYDTNVIIGCAHNVGPEKSREREISGGLPYIYPPKQNKINLLNLSEAKFYEMAKSISLPMNNWLNDNFFNISLALANELCKTAGISTDKDKIIATNRENILNLYKIASKILNLEDITPSISSDNKIYSLLKTDDISSKKYLNSVNEMVDLYFGYQVFSDKFLKLKKVLISSVNKELKKEKSRYLEHTKTLETEVKSDKYRQMADILMANIHNIKEGQEKAELENFFEDGKIISIQLDPNLSPSANAQRYYKLYNKAKSAINIANNLVNKSKIEIDYLESIKESINLSESIIELKQIQEELIGQDILNEKPEKNQKKPKKEEIQLAQFVIQEGFRIYLGKNNRQNDYLVSKIASPNDIWMHTHNIPGSHVLIKTTSEIQEIPEKIMLEAANIAAYYSQGKESSNVPVIYTKRKFLKKPPSSKPGYVTYSHEKTIFVTPDKNLIPEQI